MIEGYDKWQPRVHPALLSNLYVNDIFNICDRSRFVICADDTSLFFTGGNINDLIKDVNIFFKKLHTWTIQNDLKIYLGKTKAVAFCTRNSHCLPFFFFWKRLE